MDVSPLGSDERIGRIRTVAGFEPDITDIAMTRAGVLYAISYDTLYRVERTTALAEAVGSGLGHSDVNALDVDESGTLFAATLDGKVLTVSTATGVATEVGEMGEGRRSYGDIAFGPDGTLFAAVIGPCVGIDHLVELDPATGAATPVDCALDMGFYHVWGLGFSGQVLYGASLDTGGPWQPELIRFDLLTGRGEFVRNLSFVPFGATALR